MLLGVALLPGVALSGIVVVSGVFVLGAPVVPVVLLLLSGSVVWPRVVRSDFDRVLGEVVDPVIGSDVVVDVLLPGAPVGGVWVPVDGLATCARAAVDSANKAMLALAAIRMRKFLSGSVR